jgi:hypothetical protein
MRAAWLCGLAFWGWLLLEEMLGCMSVYRTVYNAIHQPKTAILQDSHVASDYITALCFHEGYLHLSPIRGDSTCIIHMPYATHVNPDQVQISGYRMQEISIYPARPFSIANQDFDGIYQTPGGKE